LKALVTGANGGVGTAAIQVARRLGPGKKVVTVIPDSAERYLSKDIYGRFLEDS